MFGGKIHRDFLHQRQRRNVDDVGLVGARPTGDRPPAVGGHHPHVWIDVVSEKDAPYHLVGFDVHESDVVRVAVDDQNDRSGIVDFNLLRQGGCARSHRTDQEGRGRETGKCSIEHGYYLPKNKSHQNAACKRIPGTK